MRTVRCSGRLGMGGGVCLGGVSARGVYTPHTVDRILDTHLWKHYLSTTTVADGNYPVSPGLSFNFHLPSESTSLIISCNSASVGFCPNDLITVPSSFDVMVPSPSLSNKEKASLNSEKIYKNVFHFWCVRDIWPVRLGTQCDSAAKGDRILFQSTVVTLTNNTQRKRMQKRGC